MTHHDAAANDPTGPVAVFDLEGTLTAGETWRAVGRYFGKHGQAGTYRRFLATHVHWPLRALVQPRLRQSLRDRWLIDLARLFQGMPVAEFERLAAWVVDRELWPGRRAATIAALERHRADGAVVALASGTYQPILDVFAGRLGAEALGTSLEVADGHLSGRVLGEVNTGLAKARSVASWIGRRTPVAAYGDTAADVGMLELSQAPIAVHPDRALRALAVERGWRILDADGRG